MSTILENQEKPDNEVAYSKAFSIAKEALAHVSTFRTPPTPEVYEVWYRFVEGGNAAIHEQLSHAVNIAKSVDAVQLEQLRLQFLDSSENSKVSLEVSLKLGVEMERLHSAISLQQGANSDYSNALASVNDGFLVEAVSPAEIKSHLSTLQQCNERMQRQMAEMDSRMRESQTQIDGLKVNLLASQHMLLIDPLTEVGNRRFFDMKLKEVDSLRTKSSQHCLLLVDLDNFKDINDKHGHSVGDNVLRYVAKEMQRIAVDGALARFGGDEFAIITESKEPEYAHQLANSICDFFSENKLEFKRTGSPLGYISASIGVAILRPDDDSTSWVDRADKLLYSAKNAGRNRAMVERPYARAI